MLLQMMRFIATAVVFAAVVGGCQASGTTGTGGGTGGGGTYVCTPACNGATCGNDGCGGTCGSCGSGQVCAGGKCQSSGTCTPACNGKACGSDGCGGNCGSCGEPTPICAAGQCTAAVARTMCGDSKCEAGETEANCDTDCKPPAAAHFCDSHCGPDKAPSGCFCDDQCAQYGDCCLPDGSLPPESAPNKNCTGSFCGLCAGSSSGAQCGNGKCESGETVTSCPADCKSGCSPNCPVGKCGNDGCGGLCTCPGGSTCQSGICAPTGPTAPVLTVKALGLLDFGGAKAVPGWLAHLYGKNLGGIGPFNLVEASVTNPDTVSHSYSVEVEIKGYSEVALASVKVPAKQTVKIADLPLTWKPAWKALSAPLSTQIQVRIMEGPNAVASDAVGASLYPVNYVSWSQWQYGNGSISGEDSVVTLVTPGDKTVLNLLSIAKDYSAFKSMGGYQGKDSYKYGVNLPALTFTLAPGAKASWPTWYDAGDEIDVDVSVTCSLCSDYNAGYGVYDANDESLFGWDKLGKGTHVEIAPTSGWYYHYAWNPASNSSNRIYTVKRTMTVNEIAADQLGAIFKAVQSYGVGYVSVSGSFFSSAQYVKLPSESLNSSAANCIDGALLFASALEAIGMDAFLELTPNHAFVSVRCWEGLKCILPLETTLVGKNVSAQQAIQSGIEKYSDVTNHVDIAAQRKLGFAPIPQ